MSRYRSSPYGPRGDLIDIETARAAIGQVAEERDALARQLTRAQTAITSLQRQLEARRAEAGHLAQAVRALEAQQARQPDEQQLDALRRRLLQASEDVSLLRQRSERAEARITQLELERDVAVAERDRERAACLQLETSLAELRIATPEADRAQRLAADLANVRRHRDEAIQHGIRAETGRILAEVASIRDTVARAIDASPERVGPFHDGMLAILSRADALFAREGVTLLGHVGERFDPAVHEAVGTSAQGEPGTVQAVVSSGMQLDDGTLAEPARVIVGE